MQLIDAFPNEEFKVLAKTGESEAAVMILRPGEKTGGPHNRHEKADQWMYVLAGKGQALVESRITELDPGQLLLIEKGESHEVRSRGDQPFVTLNIYSGLEY